MAVLANRLQGAILSARFIILSSSRCRPFGASRFPFGMSSSNSSLIGFLQRSYPLIQHTTIPEDDILHLSPKIFSNTSYTDSEKVETSQWLTTSSHLVTPDEDEAKHAERLGSLNIHLSTRTTLLGVKPSIADVALYFRLAPAVKTWTAEERTGEHGYHNIVRFIDFVQNAPLYGLSLSADDKIDINVDDVKYVHKPIDPKEEKERKKREKAMAAASTSGAENDKSIVVGQSKYQNAKKPKPQDSTAKEEPPASTSNSAPPSKKDKKENPAKTPKPSKPAAEASPLSPSLIDLRVGHILKAIPHPNADSRYVSTIACGDPPDTPNTSTYESQTVRTVCSGLNGLIPLSEMQNRLIVAVCNLKPVTMRGIKSAAMVLAASPRLAPDEEDVHKGPVELVQVPDGAAAGDRVYFEGWEAGSPEAVLNPKKKVWETLQPGFTTTEALEVRFDATHVDGLEEKEETTARLRTKAGYCRVPSLQGAVVR